MRRIFIFTCFSQHISFQLLQSQVIFKLARILKKINLRVAVRAERNTRVFSEE